MLRNLGGAMLVFACCSLLEGSRALSRDAIPPIRYHEPDDYFETDGKTVSPKYRLLKPRDYKFVLVIERKFSGGKQLVFMNEYYLTKANCEKDREFADSIDSANVVFSQCTPAEVIEMEFQDVGG